MYFFTEKTELNVFILNISLFIVFMYFLLLLNIIVNTHFLLSVLKLVMILNGNL